MEAFETEWVGVGAMLFPLPVGLISPFSSSDGCGNQEQMAVPREAKGKRRETSASLKGGGQAGSKAHQERYLSPCHFYHERPCPSDP